MQEITYELKYCERCGSLQLRRADSANTYCRPCQQALFRFPSGQVLSSGALHRKPRMRKDQPPILPAVAQLALAYGRLP
jgi:hypothetical protein